MKYYKINNNANWHSRPILCCRLYHHCSVGKLVEEEKIVEEEEEVAYLGAYIWLQLRTAQHYTKTRHAGHAAGHLGFAAGHLGFVAGHAPLIPLVSAHTAPAPLGVAAHQF
ncbi:hypothetical protein ACLB2K_047741 [Fragaria x ananassa]